MSKIIRTLTDTNVINVAGPKADGGIIMQPAVPPTVCEEYKCTECPECPPGGDCTAVGELQWADMDHGAVYVGTTHTVQFDTNRAVFMAGGFYDLSKPASQRAELCCDDLTWDVTYTGNGYAEIQYHIVGGLLVIYYVAIEFETYSLVATATLCGEPKGTLTYTVVSIT